MISTSPRKLLQYRLQDLRDKLQQNRSLATAIEDRLKAYDANTKRKTKKVTTEYKTDLEALRDNNRLSSQLLHRIREFNHALGKF